MKPFIDISTFALKSEHIRFLQDFIAWPKCLETGTARTESARPKRQDRKVAYHITAIFTHLVLKLYKNKNIRWSF